MEINPQFKSLKKWINCYLGPSTAEFHGLFDEPMHSAIRDENRNAIIPDKTFEINNKLFYLSVKGCGAYEDLFTGLPLKIDDLKRACRDPSLIPRINELKSSSGFIMSESWMGESPYGAQGFINGFDELKYSLLADKDSINGAHICPTIGVVQLPDKIEKTARKFFWFRIS